MLLKVSCDGPGELRVQKLCSAEDRNKSSPCPPAAPGAGTALQGAVLVGQHGLADTPWGK